MIKLASEAKSKTCLPQLKNRIGHLRPRPEQERLIAHRVILICLLTYACSNAGPEIRFRGEEKNHRTVFIVHDAWHAAIIIRKSDIPTGVLPELRDFPHAEHLEFSWGDRDYFPAPDAGLGLALKAAFSSSGSIVHVVGFEGAVPGSFASANVIEIHLPEDDFQRLVKFISATFSRPHPPSPAEAQPGLVPNGRFYAAQGKFSLLRTCNTWVAEALSSAGLPIRPKCVITAANLNQQLQPFAARKQDPQ